MAAGLEIVSSYNNKYYKNKLIKIKIKIIVYFYKKNNRCTELATKAKAVIGHCSCSIVLLYLLLQSPKPNTVLLTEDWTSAGVYLHKCIALLESGEKPVSSLFNQRQRERLYYHAYEGCLNGWYPIWGEEDRATLTEHFRQRLMQTLLWNRSWTGDDVDANLNEPQPLGGQLDADGWFLHTANPLDWARRMNPTTNFLRSSIEGLDVDDGTLYSSIEGFDVDNETGRINFVCKTDPNGLVSVLDLNEVTGLALEGAFFRLVGGVRFFQFFLEYFHDFFEIFSEFFSLAWTKPTLICATIPLTSSGLDLSAWTALSCSSVCCSATIYSSL